MTTIEGWELNHVGMVTAKKNRILHYLQSKGVGVSVGPQPLLPYIEGQTTVEMYRTLEGDPVSSTSSSDIPGAHTFYDGESQIGTCQLECIQPGPGSFIHDYLESKGEGINHLCFNVPDVAGETQKLLDQGCNMIFSAVTGGQIVENYLDTRKHGDVIISLRPPAGDWERAWKANNVRYPLVSDWDFRSIGVVVDDLDETIEYYDFLGFTDAPPEIIVESEDRLRIRQRNVPVGPLNFEFSQTESGDWVGAQALANRGEGIFSLNFAVGDLAAETVRLTGNGLDVALSASTAGDAFAYFDAREVGNTLVKLTQR